MYKRQLNNCSIEIIAENQLNLVGVFNNGNLDTHMETRADNLVIESGCIRVQIVQRGMKESIVYGIFNHLANSISLQNTFEMCIRDRCRTGGKNVSPSYGK